MKRRRGWPELKGKGAATREASAPPARLRSPAPSSLATRRAQATSRGTGVGARPAERAPAGSGFVADPDADGSRSLQISTPAQAEVYGTEPAWVFSVLFVFVFVVFFPLGYRFRYIADTDRL